MSDKHPVMSQMKHLRERVAERFGIRFTHGMRKKAVQQILEGEAPFLGDAGKTRGIDREYRLVFVAGEWMVAVWVPGAKAIATLMPPTYQWSWMDAAAKESRRRGASARKIQEAISDEQTE